MTTFKMKFISRHIKIKKLLPDMKKLVLITMTSTAELICNNRYIVISLNIIVMLKYKKQSK